MRGRCRQLAKQASKIADVTERERAALLHRDGTYRALADALESAEAAATAGQRRHAEQEAAHKAAVLELRANLEAARTVGADRLADHKATHEAAARLSSDVERLKASLASKDRCAACLLI